MFTIFRTFWESRVTSSPLTHARPDVGVRRVLSIFTVVVFPAPLGPSKPNSSPCGISRSRFFFFQAEDGIRDGRVTGVQTCALPICLPAAGDRQVPTRFCRCAGG